MTSITKLFGAALAVTVVVMSMAGCGRDERTPIGHAIRSAPVRSGSPSADDTAGPDGSYPTAEPFAPTTAPVPTAPVPTAPPDTTAVACGGQPSASQVIAAVRRDRNLLPSGVTPRVLTGPLCAGSWQYTIMDVPNRDPLQVVTRGAATSLAVVTAGTYVCTPEVTGAAPGGIISAAHCR